MSIKDILSKVEGLTQEQIEKIGEHFENEVNGLVSKKNELLEKVRRKDTAEKAEIEQLRAWKEQKDLEDLESKKQYEQALKISEERYKKEIEKTSQTLKEKESKLSELVFRTNLQKKFDEHKVNPATREPLTAFFKQKAKIEEDNILLDEKPLDDFFAEWAASETAKPFLLVPQNSGGGATSQSGKIVASNNLTERLKASLNK
jgi:hypothetical protein